MGGVVVGGKVGKVQKIAPPLYALPIAASNAASAFNPSVPPNIHLGLPTTIPA